MMIFINPADLHLVTALKQNAKGAIAPGRLQLRMLCRDEHQEKASRSDG